MCQFSSSPMYKSRLHLSRCNSGRVHGTLHADLDGVVDRSRDTRRWPVLGECSTLPQLCALQDTAGEYVRWTLGKAAQDQKGV